MRHHNDRLFAEHHVLTRQSQVLAGKAFRRKRGREKESKHKRERERETNLTAQFKNAGLVLFYFVTLYLAKLGQDFLADSNNKQANTKRRSKTCIACLKKGKKGRPIKTAI